MRRRLSTIGWSLFFVVTIGIAAIWLVLQFRLLPVTWELWLDMYSGADEWRMQCWGVPVKSLRYNMYLFGTKEAGRPYADPAGREEWVFIGESLPNRDWNATMKIDMPRDQYPEWYRKLCDVSESLRSEPLRRETQRQLLLNCLEVARVTRDAGLIEEYLDLAREQAPPGQLASPGDLPSADSFLEKYVVYVNN